MQLQALDRERTIALMALSPLEIHGPHLPIGTDVIVAEELQRRVIQRLQERHPELDFLLLPSTYLGADTVPIPPSVNVDSRALYYLILATGRSLAVQGFHYLFITDNHGGPRHQIAIEKAVRQLYRRYRFAVVAPFLHFCRRMTELDPELLQAIGAGPGSVGDATDIHAGTNETSLMLAIAPGKVAPSAQTLPLVAVDPKPGVGGLLRRLAVVVRAFGGRQLARDLEHLAVLLNWTGMKEKMPTYIGNPSLAKAEAGHRMLEAHAEMGVLMLERVMAGEPPFSQPVLWGLRFIEPS